MKLTFKRNDTNDCSLSQWNGVTVILRDSEAFGELDVMFTGHSNSGKAIFARLIPDYNIKVVSSGFYEAGNTIQATGKTEDDKSVFFTPGLINNYVYVSNHSFGNIGCLPLIKSEFYLTQMADYSYKCIGVEDPSLIKGFTSQFNPSLIEYTTTLGLNVGELLFSEYWGKQFTVEVVKVNSWNTGLGRNTRSGEVGPINLSAFHRNEDVIRNKQSSYIHLFSLRQST